MTNSWWRWTVLMLATCPWSTWGQEEARSIDSEEVIQATALGSADIGSDYSLDIWPGSRNTDRPARQRQYYYQPIISPTSEPDGKGGSRSQFILRSDGTITLKCNFRDEGVHALVLRRLNELLGPEAMVPSGNLQVLPVTKVVVNIGNFPAGLGSYQSDYALAGARFFHFTVTPAEGKSEELLKWLSGAAIRVTLKYSARTTSRNAVEIRVRDLARTSLKARLDGLGKKQVDVYRNDVRTLCKNISSEVTIAYHIEEPEQFSDSVVSGLLSQFTSRVEVDLEKWDQDSRESTYNSQDLTPDAIKEYLNHAIRKDQGEDQWKVTGSAETGGTASVLGIFSAGGNFKSSYSKEELQKYLHERDLTVEFKGDQIIPKKLWVRRFNMSDFDTARVICDVKNYVSKPGEFNRTEDVRLSSTPFGGLPLDQQVAQHGTRIEQLEEEVKRLTRDIAAVNSFGLTHGRVLFPVNAPLNATHTIKYASGRPVRQRDEPSLLIVCTGFSWEFTVYMLHPEKGVPMYVSGQNEGPGSKPGEGYDQEGVPYVVPFFDDSGQLCLKNRLRPGAKRRQPAAFYVLIPLSNR